MLPWRGSSPACKVMFFLFFFCNVWNAHMEGNNKEVIGEKSLNEKLNFSQLVPFGGSLVFLPPIEETEKGQHLP